MQFSSDVVWEPTQLKTPYTNIFSVRLGFWKWLMVVAQVLVASESKQKK